VTLDDDRPCAASRRRTAPSSLRRYATAIAHAALDGRDDAQVLPRQLAAYRRQDTKPDLDAVLSADYCKSWEPGT
jgi:hypothetical protein